MDSFKWRPVTKVFQRNYIIGNKGADAYETKHYNSLTKQGQEQVKQFDHEICNFEHKNVFEIQAKKFRKVKNLFVYSLQEVGGTIKKFCRKLELPDWKKFYNLGKDNKVVGFTSWHVGFRPGRPITFYNYFIASFKNNNEELKRLFPGIYQTLLSRLINYREVWSGSPDSNTGHLKGFMKDGLNTISAEELIERCAKSSWLRQPVLDFEDPREMVWAVNFNKDSHNGHVTSRMLGCSAKGYSVMGALRLAMQRYDYIRRFPIKNFCLWDVFCREKDCKLKGVDGEEYSTRVVLTPEHHVTMLLSWVYQKWMRSFYAQQDDDRCFLIEGEYNGSKAAKIRKKIFKYDYYVDADWSQFDASIDKDWMIAASVIMFSNSLKTKADYKFFYHIISAATTKYVVVPPGIVVELNRGNPSGTPGVSAINCVVNIMRWVLIGIAIYGEEHYEANMGITVYGDDAEIGFNEHDNLYKLDDIIKDFGWKSDPILPNLYPTYDRDSHDHVGPDFLKRRFNDVGVYWNRDKVVDKLLYQSKTRNAEDQILLIKGFAETGPHDDEFNAYAEYMIKNICTQANFDYNDYKLVLDKDRFNINISPSTLDGFDYDANARVGNKNFYLVREEGLKQSFTGTNEWRRIWYMSENNELVRDFKLVCKGDLNSVNNVERLFETFNDFGVDDNYFAALINSYLSRLAGF